MKTENIFKFVAIRPPKRKNTAESFVVHFDNRTFQDKIQQKVSEGMQYYEAQNVVAREVVNSPQYFTKIAELQPLFGAESRLKDFLKSEKLKAKDIKDISAYVLSTIDNLKSIIPGLYLNQLLQDPSYETIKKQLWNSLYSNYILRAQSPTDKDRIVFWVRMFQVFDAVKSGDVSSFFERLLHFNQMLPALPKEYIFSAQPSGASDLKVQTVIDKKENEDSRREKIRILKNEIERLKDMKIKLRNLFEQKKADFREQKVAQKTIRKFKDLTKATGKFISQHSNKPLWIISENDLKNDKELLSVLQKVNIKVNGMSVFEMISKIDALIATKISALDDLQHIEEIKVVQGVFVRTRKRLI